MTPIIRTVLAVVGLALLVVAAGMVAAPLGVAAAGAALLVVAVDTGERAR